MPWYGWAAAGILALILLYLFLMAPSRKRLDASKLINRQYAHRGLHDGNRQVFENSMQAFSLAADQGYGIELDVQLTRDHRLVVHHDASTARICGEDHIITQTDYADLPALPDGSPIPRFEDFLALIAGRIPLVVEIKSYGDHEKTTASALALLRAYQGPYCVESFHPQIVRYVRLHAPEVIRGQLASGKRYTDTSKPFFTHFVRKHLLCNVLGRPHFIAYDCSHRASPSLLLAKRLFGAILIAWTVKNQPALDKARARYSSWIFEGFTPRQ
ncbi:MAG TPA: glycerophosphodiester phosphodiesterase family protein [Candidatus Limiplasma sp.]|mgnify:CR=1 FL=1|nr:glycerophosphodiester phosphodiesterase family protein [Candidatus Limiplasma sp.]